MLVIRMQRTGRKGHAMFRVVVQDSRRTPTSGKIIAALGSYDPHAKASSLNKEKVQFYLDHGAQPSDRVVLLLKQEGIKLPTWVTPAGKKAAAIRNLEKLRRNRPPEPAAPAEESAAETPIESEGAPAEVIPTTEQAEESTTEAETSAAAPEETPSEPEVPVEEAQAEAEGAASTEASEPETTEAEAAPEAADDAKAEA